MQRGDRVALMSGGELTVTVRGNGSGGPNQEYALGSPSHSMAPTAFMVLPATRMAPMVVLERPTIQPAPWFFQTR